MRKLFLHCPDEIQFSENLFPVLKSLLGSLSSTWKLYVNICWVIFTIWNKIYQMEVVECKIVQPTLSQSIFKAILGTLVPEKKNFSLAELTSYF